MPMITWGALSRSRWLLGLTLVLLPGVSGAALQRVEAVGTFGISDKARSRVTPRDQAVQAAIWEGVSRVAIEEIGEFSSTQEDVELVRKALGEDMLPYARSFRILEDKGESPVLFAEDPNITTEYIVVVEVVVDVDRVKQALDRAGLIADGGVQAVDAPVLVELVGVGRHDAFDAIRQSILSDLGAVRVETLGFAHERQLLSVVGSFGPRELANGLQRLAGADWTLEPIGVDAADRRIRVQARFAQAIDR